MTYVKKRNNSTSKCTDRTVNIWRAALAELQMQFVILIDCHIFDNQYVFGQKRIE